MKKSIIYPLILSMAALLFMATGCSKSSPSAIVGFHFHTYIYDTVVDPFLYPVQAFPDSLGRVEHLGVAQFYVTNVAFRNKSTQQWYTIPGSIFLKRIQNEEYAIGNMPAGTYDDVSFTVGVGNALNSASPSAYNGGADTVLSATEQAVMWGSGMPGTNATTGYTFMNGYGDTVNVTLPFPGGFTIAANQPNTLQLIHIIADYGKLLQAIRPINPGNNNSSFYGPSPAPAQNLWQNIINMFRYECTSPTELC
jgi:hypothetical protein